MIEKEKLELYAEKLLFKMNDDEYETLQKEFDVILKQMDLIGKIDGIKDVKPMTFPFVNYKAKFREDEVKDTLETEDLLVNAKMHDRSQIRVPKVVE
ncbi:MAG: Asp-tRNA(Asn)/Glu-tRNA(Gln) amidotransferase subunit GatC [Clostridium sp.]|nr:Asp-tRNA(Asn)/Glu-tRNA(Gln) amidotransferase subunit GatC [Clostridium sp.]MCM1444269.1 Asp-tRNA(Asn)/Glu-tRNA(Gln) amidotransferase subunit GatC [Candidatus Amulumruptor caecigallinarius]